jgi:restriction system protein
VSSGLRAMMVPYSAEAKHFGKSVGMSLVDGSQMKALRGVNSGQIRQEISCPRCGSEMVRRVAKRGRNAGSEFLGCSRFPQCRGIRSF